MLRLLSGRDRLMGWAVGGEVKADSQAPSMCRRMENHAPSEGRVVQMRGGQDRREGSRGEGLRALRA